MFCGWFTGMQLSKFSDYSLRVLMHAALSAPALVTIDEVAGAFDISRNHLVKVVHTLGANGFLATRRGLGGGFTLAKPSNEIRLGSVVRLTEAGETVVDCQAKPGRLCRIFPACRLKGILGEAAAAFYSALDRYSLADLVKPASEMKLLLKI
jgi:Rrf2 family nitric oxide-sensitive transcriptional repressor